jgi:hypothetical protein
MLTQQKMKQNLLAILAYSDDCKQFLMIFSNQSSIRHDCNAIQYDLSCKITDSWLQLICQPSEFFKYSKLLISADHIRTAVCHVALLDQNGTTT